MIASQEEDKEVGNTRNKTTLVLKKKEKHLYTVLQLSHQILWRA